MSSKSIGINGIRRMAHIYPHKVAAPKNTLATAGSEDGIKKMIAQYWYTNPDRIELEDMGDGNWKIWQQRDSGEWRLMLKNIVTTRRGRFVFEQLDNPLPPEDDWTEAIEENTLSDFDSTKLSFSYDPTDPVDYAIMQKHDPTYYSDIESGIMSAARQLAYGVELPEIIEYLSEEYGYSPEKIFLMIQGAKILNEEWNSERAEQVF